MTRFRLVPEQSAVVIEATSSVHPIHSRTDGVEGFVDLDTAEGQLSLAVARLGSGNPLEDRELRRRIDAKRFPTIDGKLSELRAVEGENRYAVRGEVTFRGVTRSHEDEMTFTALDNGDLRIEGTTTFDIRDFGMEPPRVLLLRVHPEVTVRLEAVARPESGDAR